MAPRVSPEVLETRFYKVIELTQKGHALTTACNLVGIHASAFWRIVKEKNLVHLLPPKRKGKWTSKSDAFLGSICPSPKPASVFYRATQ